MVEYGKPYLPVDDQIGQLKARGLEITDDARARECLHRIGYYRLSAYWYLQRKLQVFQDSATGTLSHRRLDEFEPGSRLQDVVALYVFDKRLRILVADALERIEVAIRVSVAYRLGQLDPFAHTNPQLLDPRFSINLNSDGRSRHEDWLDILAKSVRRSREDFVKHFQARYEGPLPIWIAIELWDFGSLSVFFSGLRGHDRHHIGRSYGLPHGGILASWLHTLTYVRNLVAHHSRFWNRTLVTQPKLPDHGSVELLDHIHDTPESQGRAYVVLCICLYLLRHICPRSGWRSRLLGHLDTLPHAPGMDLVSMGFPEGWRKERIWTE